MGIITLEKSDNLIWLGRYTERVYTTLKYYFDDSDFMIEHDPMHYAAFCQKVGIPQIYKDREDFVERYPFDEQDPNSIISNLNRAYDNAIVMRDYIGTETMAYIQLALDDIKQAERGATPIADLMLVIDHILAFWGCISDEIDDEQIRNIIRLGKGIERVDLYLRLENSRTEIVKQYNRLKQYLEKSKMHYDTAVLNTADMMIQQEDVDYETLRNLLQNLLK